MTANGKCTLSDLRLGRLLGEADRKGVDAPMLQRIVDAIPDNGDSLDVKVDEAALLAELDAIGGNDAGILADSFRPASGGGRKGKKKR